jgi:hypothetical protein
LSRCWALRQLINDYCADRVPVFSSIVTGRSLEMFSAPLALGATAHTLTFGFIHFSGCRVKSVA